VQDDIEYGEKLLIIFKVFIEHLIQTSLSKKTIQKHADNLWLLGGDVIRAINIDKSLRKK
jgi:hypothetical protein